MKLLTKEIENKFKKHPLCPTEGQSENAEVIVKYFNPYGAGTWLITEAEQQPDGDWLLYGYCHIFEWEWGYVLLSQLEELRPCKWDRTLKLERDLYAKGTVAELSAA